ncbi:hypothetical protein J7K24_01575 [bacterium]|nr:hypothetical protein [bacterium]
MAITIVEQRKTQKHLVIVLGIALAGILFILLAKFVKIEEIPVPSLPSPRLPKIEINFDVLENPTLKELTEPFPELPSLSSVDIDQCFGRENPFQEMGWGEFREMYSSGEEGEINE